MSGSALPWLPLVAAAPPTPERLALLGGKAGPLAQLAARGYPVWPGVVLPPPPAPCPSPDPATVAALLAALAALPPGSGGLAVRSSAPQEDGRRSSYAGQYVTRLGVPPDALAAAIAAVWQSGTTPAQRAYRHLRGEASPPAMGPMPLPAVLVQPMLPARVAGVAFGADPLSGRRDRTLVQAVAGLAGDLVAGRVSGERAVLGPDGRILEHQPAQPGLPLLDPATLARLQRLIAALGQELAGPQDVEWALDADGTLWLLQVRPITALADGSAGACGDGAPGLWDNSNIVESYAGVTTPLTFSFARKAYTEVYRGFCRFMGVPEAVIRRHPGVFATMIGFQQGRIYYNLLSWYRVLSLLPGYSLNAAFLEQMLGVREPLAAAERRRLRLEPPLAAPGEIGRLLRALGGLVGNAFTLERRRRAFRRRLERVLLGPAQLAAVAAGAPEGLVAHYRRIEAQLLPHWDAPLINDFYAMVVYGLLGRLLARWRLDSQGRLLQAWITDLGAVISAEPHRRIAAMGRRLAADPALVALLAGGSAAAIAPALAARPLLRAEIEAYLDAFGDRCLGELKLETRTLRDDPLPLLRSLAAAAVQADAAPQARREAAGAGPPPALPAGLAAPQRWLLGWLRRRLRLLLAERENLRFERTRVFGQARRLLLSLGQRLAERGLLEQADDAVFLEVEELLAVVEGTGTTADLRALVELRRADWRRHRAAPPLPRRFATHGLPCLDLPIPAVSAAAAGGMGEESPWQGLGCSPGRVRAPVERVADPVAWLERRRPAAARPILVAQATDPGWVLLFPHAAGLLVERGSALSHVAIVAREVGLPMVTELAGISGRLADGDRVEIDGASGRVRLLVKAADG